MSLYANTQQVGTIYCVQFESFSHDFDRKYLVLLSFYLRISTRSGHILGLTGQKTVL